MKASPETIMYALVRKYNELGELMEELAESLQEPKPPQVKLCPTCGSQDFEQIGLMGEDDPITVCTVCKNQL